MSHKTYDLDKLWGEFTGLLKTADRDKYPEFFFYYTRHTLTHEGFDKYVRNLNYLFEIAERPIAGSNVLDVGCGFGIDSMIMAAQGAKVNGIDVNPDADKIRIISANDG